MPNISEEQAAKVRAWLEQCGYRKEDGSPGQSELWFSGSSRVQLKHVGESTRVEIDDAGAQGRSRSLQDLVGMRANWPEALTVSAIELATMPAEHSQSQGSSFKGAPGKWLYRTLKPWAHGVKVLLQMLIGIGAVVDVGIHVAHSVATRTGTAPFAPSVDVSVRVIAYALAVAAAIELAYTLFTPGPDEALDPLMLGVSSGILILITEGVSATVEFAGLIIGVAALAILFLVRRYLLGQEDE